VFRLTTTRAQPRTVLCRSETCGKHLCVAIAALSMLELMPIPTAVHKTRNAPAGVHADDAWTLDTLVAVWERQHHRVYDRIDLIERAIAALANDSLDADLRREAERAAHMLAGSVGMFGFMDASDAAHSLESELAHPTPDRAPELSALTSRVRRGVQGAVVLCSDVVASTRPRPASLAR
jgi:HPt (histidine-containing phosphotransfer) domain-containing protein